MRVLHIGSGNLYGGVETIQVTLARYRHECPQMEPHFTVCFEGRLSRELRELEVPVHNLGPVRVRNPFSIRSARAQLRKLLSNVHYDAAICHSAWSQAILGPVVRSAGIPLLLWLHGAPSRHWLERWAKRTPLEKIICCSEFTRNLIARVYPGVPSAVVYAPVSPIVKPVSEAQRCTVRSELSTPLDAVVIIQVSRMEAWKGHQLHLEALAKMRHIPRWMCWFVGGAQRPEEKSYVQELKSKAEQYGIAHRIRFLGQRTDIPRLLTASDLFCQPNVGPEPFGIVFVEALSAGLPVITTAMGGPTEIIRSNCGVLIPPKNASELAVSLKRLTLNHEPRRQMSDSAPLRAAQLCDPSMQVKRLFGVIEKTVASACVA